MKLEKESFIKYHFWYMLGLLFPLIFLTLIMLWTSTAGAVAAKQKDVDESKKKLDGVVKGEARNQKWVDALEKKLKAITGQESKNWKAAWEPQADIMAWPPALVDKMKDAYFGDPIDSRLRADYTKEDQYASQIDPIIEIVQPVNARGEGAVQCASGNWNSFLQLADWSNDPTPSAEEIWLAQEDLWIQRELLHIIREANDSVALLKKLDKPPKLDKAQQEIDHQIFANPTWRIEVALVGEVPKLHTRWQATNVSKQRQVLGINFTVRFRGAKATDTLFLDGEPLGPDQSTDPKEQALGGQLELDRPEGLESITQIFDWRTAPVKRIEKVGLGFHSQRFHPRGLKPAPFPLIKAPDTKAAGAKPPGSPGPTPPGTGRRPPGNAPSRPGGEAAQTGSDFTDAGLQRDRYMEQTTYVRRMPVAMELIVDQTNIQDVLTAFANSKLRIQIMQWHFARFYDNIKPKTAERVAQSNQAGSPPPARPSDSNVGIFGNVGLGRRIAAPGPQSGRPGPPGRARVATAGAQGGPNPSMEEQEWELVQLCVYGVASLYERYPPRDAAALATLKDAGTAQKPGAKPAAAPAAKPGPPPKK